METQVLLCSLPPDPPVIVLIARSHNGLVLAGTDFTLTVEIFPSDLFQVDKEILPTICWNRDDVIITSNDRISTSSVTVTENGYTASLTYSPIAISDSGLITATVTVSPSDNSMYIQSVTATATETLIVQSMC